ncbi:retinol dehydrogenase 12-like [Lytechinus pictus]|uniref:retinol dehydrogenase 12-like n=1 Tax=Lytechinus pictus TaxID=7653 RepID=UPI0030B9E587
MGSRLTTQPNLPEVDLRGRVAIVTGANAGIGYETAKSLAQMGARVIMACRSEMKALEAIDCMKEEHKDERELNKRLKVKIQVEELDLEYMNLDLGSLASTTNFAESFKARDIHLHILVCNAGMAFGPDEPSVDGMEIHFQVNYLSHFLLTLHLLPVLKSSGPNTRIVLVSSLAYSFARWNEDDMQCLNTANKTTVYSNTKLYQIMQMFSLERRLEGSGISVFSLHPGVVETELVKREGQRIPLMPRMFARLGMSTHMLRSPFKGALTTLHAAVNPTYDGKSALYFESSKPHWLMSQPRDRWKQEHLWKYSLECLRNYMTEDMLDVFTS